VFFPTFFFSSQKFQTRGLKWFSLSSLPSSSNHRQIPEAMNLYFYHSHLFHQLFCCSQFFIVIK
jgi:hypothetical protein